MGKKKSKQDTETPTEAPTEAPSEAPCEEAKPFHDLTGEEQVVFEYLYYQNRPYNALTIHDNLRGTIKKAQLQKILDKLTDTNKLQAKEFGKVKIYLVNQQLIPVSNDSELIELESEIKDLEKEVEAAKVEVKELQVQAKELENTLSLEEILEQIKERETNLNGLNAEIEELNKAGCVSEELRKEVEGKLRFVQVEEKKRLKIWNEVLAGIAEMIDEPKKRIIELIGIEN